MSPSGSRPTRFAARQRRTVALAAVAVLAVGMSACGSSSDTSTGAPSGGTSQRPSWDISSAKGPIGRISPEEPICELYALAPGDVVKGRFIVYFKDLEASPHDTTIGDVRATEPESREAIAGPTGSPLARAAKERIANRMRQLKLPDGDQGWAELSRVARRFEAVDDESRE